MPQVPLFIKCFFIADILLALLYGANVSAGSPFMKINRLLDLDGEGNLPTWYSSIQWAASAALFAFVAFQQRDRRTRASVALFVIALMFGLLSMDEVAQVHEKLSIGVSGKVGSGQGRWKGMWLPALGFPVLLILGFAARAANDAFKESPRCLRCLLIGLAVFGLGAFGIEPVLNVLNASAGPALVLLEETSEMIGVTFLLWSGLQLAQHTGLMAFAPAPSAADRPGERDGPRVRRE